MSEILFKGMDWRDLLPILYFKLFSDLIILLVKESLMIELRIYVIDYCEVRDSCGVLIILLEFIVTLNLKIF
jgi:hypothetical protein